MFGDLRIQHNFPTRNPKDRPKDLPITVDYGDRKERLRVPITDHPSLLVMPAFSMPGMLLGLTPSAIWPEAKFHVWQHRWDRQSLAGCVTRQGGKGIEITKKITPGPFARMLAKIGHTFAIATGKLDGFRPLLPELILGRNPDAAFLVGGRFEIMPPSGYGHEIYLESGQVGAKEIIAARIRLFSNVGTPNHGTPTYYAVVGERDITCDAQTAADVPLGGTVSVPDRAAREHGCLS
jgi:hypothetical protein